SHYGDACLGGKFHELIPAAAAKARVVGHDTDLGDAFRFHVIKHLGHYVAVRVPKFEDPPALVGRLNDRHGRAQGKIRNLELLGDSHVGHTFAGPRRSDDEGYFVCLDELLESEAGLRGVAFIIEQDDLQRMPVDPARFVHVFGDHLDGLLLGSAEKRSHPGDRKHHPDLVGLRRRGSYRHTEGAQKKTTNQDRTQDRHPNPINPRASHDPSLSHWNWSTPASKFPYHRITSFA